MTRLWRSKPRAMTARFWRYVVIARHSLSLAHRPFDTCVRLDAIRNRYSYLILRFLSSQRYPIAVLRRTPYVVNPVTNEDHYARLAFAHKHAIFLWRDPADVTGMTLVHDGSDPQFADRPWDRIVTLDYDVSALPPDDQAWMIMPYSMHPLTYAAGLDHDLHALRHGIRPIRLFFAGNVDRRSYSERSMRTISERFGMLNRIEVVATALGLPGDMVRLITSDTDLDDAITCRPRKCIIAAPGTYRVRHERWLQTLALSDVFLAPPGSSMPLSHNIIEAMAVGCIPLTNYAGWFSPRLEDGVNCLEFHDRAELLTRLHDVLAADATTLASIRRGVIEYYDSHLAPEAFLNRVRASSAKRLRVYVNREEPRILEAVHPESVLVCRGRRN